jgi:hypothetical protein
VEGRYIVAFVDELGGDRAREFDSLSDARDFRDALKLAEAPRPGSSPWSTTP